MKRSDHPWYKLIDSPERAEFVKNLRCTIGCTWRRVAELCNQEWHGNWNSNQLAGMYMCEAAAKYLNEDPDKEPWN